MTENPLSLRFDGELLAVAAEVLSSEGFTASAIAAPKPAGDLLLAENHEFVVAVAQFQSRQDLVLIEGAASIAVAELLHGAGPKRWDAYLVLITDQAGDDEEMSSEINDILYNTRYVRRLVRWEVTGTDISMRNALRPFIGLPTSLALEFKHPVAELIERLPLHGISRDEAEALSDDWTREHPHAFTLVETDGE